MKTREWLLLETLNVVKRVLKTRYVRSQYDSVGRIRKPTVKETAKYPKLLRKQRARFGGV